MTRGACRRRFGARGLGLVSAALFAAACGGPSPTHHSHSATTSTTSATTSRTAPAPAKVPTSLSEMARAADGTTFGSTVAARPGDSVLLQTIVPPAGATATARATVLVTEGPAKTLKVTATEGRQHSTATITTATGTPIVIAQLRYSCNLPPLPNFCPVRGAHTDRRGYSLTFTTTHDVPITLVAEIGPVVTPPVIVHHASDVLVPAYTAIEELRAAPPAPAGASTTTTSSSTTSAPVALTTTAAAQPGDILTMVTRLTGSPVGAPQPTTITIDQGPSKALTISARAAAGKTTTATVTSATGSPIELVLAHYPCFAPPIENFCPATSIRAHGGRYELTFMSSPFTRAPVVLATVAAG